MAVLRVLGSDRRRNVCVVPGEPSPIDIKAATSRGRQQAWIRAGQLGRRPTGWALEYFKAMLGPSECSLGAAQILAEDCVNGALALPDLPATPESFHATRSALASHGFIVRGLWLQQMVDRILFTCAALLALLPLMAFVARRRCKTQPPASTSLVLALHSEWSNRTRHVLEQLQPAQMPDMIVLLGRSRLTPGAASALWSTKLNHVLPPVYCPVSLRAAAQMLNDLPRIISDGLAEASAQPLRPDFREQVAIAFRVLLGAVSARWWLISGVNAGTVIFGHTGTADTTAIEQAMQESGMQTAHAVHGLATGPNFVGISDLAFFRCGYDARAYESLNCYGACIAQRAPRKMAGRGAGGILLLTNLAHPMNPDFVAQGLEGEFNLLHEVAGAVRLLGDKAGVMLWKPHPVIAQLPIAVAAELRREAAALGYQELPHGPPIISAAASVRWVLTSPSTVCVDLLSEGVLSLVIDPKGSLLDYSPALFPSAALSAKSIAAALNELDDASIYDSCLLKTIDVVVPAGNLDVHSFFCDQGKT